MCGALLCGLVAMYVGYVLFESQLIYSESPQMSFRVC